MKLFGQTTSLFSTTHSVTKPWTESKGWSPSLYHQPWSEKVASMNFNPALPPMHLVYRFQSSNRRSVSARGFRAPFTLFKSTDDSTVVKQSITTVNQKATESCKVNLIPASNDQLA